MRSHNVFGNEHFVLILSMDSTLKGNGITGGIPDDFGNLTSLTSLDLEDNQLSGLIPSTLGNLKKLQFL